MKMRFTALVMALAMIFSLSLSTTASATNNDAANAVIGGGFVPVDESSLTRDCALALLGLTEEEATAEGIQLYVSTNPPASPMADKVVNAGESVVVDETKQLSDTTSFGNKVTIKGNRICWAVGVVYVSGNGVCKADLRKFSDKYFAPEFQFSPSYTKKSHEFMDITYGTVVQFKFTVPRYTTAKFAAVIGVSNSDAES